MAHNTDETHETLIAPLFDGPLDVVGDVHGEIEALEALLTELGYDAEGQHPDNRRLVFLGDLVDRGPDSPAVLLKVKTLVEAGRAQCILGNHELNLLRDDARPDNSWWTAPEQPTRHPEAGVSEADKPGLKAFIKSLPLALERDDLRVVHACWHQRSVDKLKQWDLPDPDIADLYEHYLFQIREQHAENRTLNQVRREWNEFAPRLHDPDWEAVILPIKSQFDARVQMDNPVAVLTSGEETPAREPFWAGGKWRMVSRVKWWQHYKDDVPVIIGHYWRRFSEAQLALKDKHGPDLFAGLEPHHWMGPNDNVYCVDFSVGARPTQRAANQPLTICKLAAVRVPEWEVVHDDGERMKIIGACP
ncbi:MAG: metallophosphoesterase [Gammaproteobacteria bacterium]